MENPIKSSKQQSYEWRETEPQDRRSKARQRKEELLQISESDLTEGEREELDRLNFFLVEGKYGEKEEEESP